METHALDLLHFAIWLLIGIGASTMALAGYFVRQFVVRMDKQDDSLEAIRFLLASEVTKLREMQHGLDKRLIWLESTCVNHHGMSSMKRRHDDEITGGGSI
jgi:hypothetical protein